MTIAILIKVNDGFVLASDSATSVGTAVAEGNVLVALNVYNNANKIFNLRKGSPIAAMTWGLGNIGQATISTLAKDLRARFSDEADEWYLGNDYKMSEVSERFKQHFWDDKYQSMLASLDSPLVGKAADGARLGLLVAGYSSGAAAPEIFHLDMSPDGCGELTPVFPDECGASAWGQPEAFARIMNGASLDLPQALIHLGAPEEQAALYVQALKQQISTQMVSPAMPIQDAIDLAEFLVQVTIGFVRFNPGSPTVGGPIEIAAITKHEGFKWVKRKHFFDRGLN